MIGLHIRKVENHWYVPVHCLERISRPQHGEGTEIESTRLLELVEDSEGLVKPSQVEITGWKTGEEGAEQKKNLEIYRGYSAE